MATKPQMRGLLVSQIKSHFGVACVLTGVVCTSVYFGLYRRRKLIYQEFKEKYNPDADYLRMREAGIFSCIGPGGKRRTMEYD